MKIFLKIDFYIQFIASILALVILLLPLDKEYNDFAVFYFFYIIYGIQSISILIKMFYKNNTVYYKIHRIFIIPVWSLWFGHNLGADLSVLYSLYILVGLPVIMPALYIYDCYRTMKKSELNIKQTQ
jgi:hypothetical protein